MKITLEATEEGIVMSWEDNEVVFNPASGTAMEMMCRQILECFGWRELLKEGEV
jgi:hypothetical protein